MQALTRSTAMTKEQAPVASCWREGWIPFLRCEMSGFATERLMGLDASGMNSDESQTR
jgi:hypothetical protein